MVLLLLACQRSPAPPPVPAEPVPAPEAAPEPERKPELQVTEAPLVRAEWRCDVEITGVLEDGDYRGYPNTPASVDAYEALDADMQAMMDAEGHGETYKLCRYAVLADGTAYAWTHTWQTTMQALPSDWCSAAIPTVEASIQTTTKGCKEPDAGAYWGRSLVPLDAPD
jgi:hypothetical protein